MIELSPCFAAIEPHGYRDELISGLSRRSKFGKQLWQAVVQAGNVSLENVHVDASGWGSRSNAQRGDIHLGAQPLPKGNREQLIFNDKAISYDQEVSLRFLHELGHLFEASRINAGSDSIENLLQTTQAVRRVNQDLGLSAVGSLSFYKPDMKFREDSSELIAMYAFDPDYLRSFLSYVDDSTKSAELNGVGITSIPGYGNDLFALVHDTVQEGIRA